MKKYTVVAICLLLIYAVFVLFLGCKSYNKNDETINNEQNQAVIQNDENQTPIQAERTFPSMPQSIVDILDSEPDNYGFQNVRRQLETFRNGNYSMGIAMEQAMYSGSDQLIIEMTKYYQTYPHLWGTVDICVAQEKSFEIIKMLLDSGLDITHDHGWNEVADASETVLSKFVYFNDDPRVIQLLIDHGAKVNTEVHTPSGWPQTLYQFSSVFHAARAGKAGNLRVLIENGGNIHLTGFITYGVTPLIAAAESGSHECVELLLNTGADIMTVDEFETTALMMAAKSGNEMSVRLLLEAGAGEHINAKNSWGSTALIEAAISGNGKSVKALIATGADVNMGTYEGGSWGYTQWYLYSKGLTALMFASTGDAVKALIAAGADVNIKDSDGNNAIYYQCFFYRNSETIAALIKAGSYLYLDVNRGRDLLRLSQEWSDWEQNDEIIAMLEKAGCADDNPDEGRKSYFQVDRH